jgi:hypothetical protein
MFIISSKVGETPLHKAAETSSMAVVKLLLDEGAEINPKTDAKVELNICTRQIPKFCRSNVFKLAVCSIVA